MTWPAFRETFRGPMFCLLAPFCLPVLLCFAVYFWAHRQFDHLRVTIFRWEWPWAMTPWIFTFGLLTGVGNLIWNVFFATLVFMRMPVWLNESGKFSPFFTTRMKAYRKEGHAPELVEFLIRMIQKFDPDHFGGV